MIQPDDPGPCGDAIAEALDGSDGITRPVRSFFPGLFAHTTTTTTTIDPQRARLPTAAELADNATYAAMLDVMRKA